MKEPITIALHLDEAAWQKMLRDGRWEQSIPIKGEDFMFEIIRDIPETKPEPQL